MLAVQEHLRAGHPLESLTESLVITVYRHPDLPLCGLKYDQRESPKAHPIVRDCRGLVLELGTWDVVAKPFRRFFNAGEDPESFQHFDWSSTSVSAKEDGSLVLLYHYRGEWHVNTSGSFGLLKCGHSRRTWRDLFWETSGINRGELDPEQTYVFELWTPYNKVVRAYPGPRAFLLSMFHNPTLDEASVAQADEAATRLGVPRPQHYEFASMDDVTAFLRDIEGRDSTFEGVVIRGNTVLPDGTVQANDRYKVKTNTYLELHRMLDNGNLFNPKRLVPLILEGELDEVAAYLPEVLPLATEVSEVLDREFAVLLELWRRTWQIEPQKEFALAVVKKCRFAGLLFELRKELGTNQTERALRDKWRQSGDLIVRMLYC